MITALCGGVGGSKLALGLYLTLPTNSLIVIVNTADDLLPWGLHVSPDLDTVTYTLAGIARQDVGWGIEGDTFHALQMLSSYGQPGWFQVGDRDLATHLFRTTSLKEGKRLTEVSADIAHHLKVNASILPMTDGSVATRLLAGEQWIDFQDYFVRRRHQDRVSAIRFEGIERARPTNEVLEAIRQSEIVVIVNSNPAVSILPILSLPGVVEALKSSRAKRIAVSPIVGRDSFSGPAARLLETLGHTPTATGVARFYREILEGMVIDRRDEGQAGAIQDMGLQVLCTNILMRDEADRKRVAAETVEFARSLK